MNGQPVFDALLSIVNEHEQIKALFLSPGTSKAMQVRLLEDIVSSLENMGLDQPQLMYSDQCCQDRAFYESAFPSLLVDVEPVPKTKFPSLELPFAPTLIKNEAAIDTVIDTLESDIASKHFNYIALDCEWTFDPESKVASPVATIQLASLLSVYVVHLTKCRKGTPTSSVTAVAPARLKMFLRAMARSETWT